MTHLSAVAAATDTRAVEAVSSAAMPTAASGDPSPFEGLAKPIRKALAKRGFTELTEVQSAVLASGAVDRDLQISSQTGSGKTVALGMVLAPRLLEAAAAGGAARTLSALVIVPTRELVEIMAQILPCLVLAYQLPTILVMAGHPPALKNCPKKWQAAKI